MKKKLLATLLAVSVTASLAGCGSSDSASAPAADSTADSADASATDAAEAPADAAAPSGDTITLGVIGPMTGSLAVYGTHVSNGAELNRGLSGNNASGRPVGIRIITVGDHQSASRHGVKRCFGSGGWRPEYQISGQAVTFLNGCNLIVFQDKC